MKTILFVTLCVAALVQSMPSTEIMEDGTTVTRIARSSPAEIPVQEGMNAVKTMQMMGDAFSDGIQKAMGMFNPNGAGMPGMGDGIPGMGGRIPGGDMIPGMHGKRR